MDNPLRHLPSVNELLENPQIRQLVDKASHNAVVDGVRNVLDDVRSRVRETAASDFKVPSPSEIVDTVVNWVNSDTRQHLQPVINATGVLLHTGLGRAPLAKEAIDAIQEISSGYASVEVDIESGLRSKRILAVESLLRELTGAEAACVVNNNAAATMIALNTVACAKEVIVSRGELIEIGGSYRLPDVMSASGAILKEVGTTNKTRIADYANNLDEQTGALFRAHTSNYVVVGFTESPSLAELIALSKKTNVPFIDDIGSGAVFDFSEFGLTEPLVDESVKAGSDLILFSGDKLLGGPQCGIILGKAEWIERINKNPMMRALRVDKITLSALHATLQLYRKPEVAKQSIPLLSLLSTPIENLKLRAERLAAQLAALSLFASAEPMADQATLGGGSIPTQQIDTWCVALAPANGSIDQLASALRNADQSIFGRVKNEKLLLDLRTIFPGQEIDIVEVCKKLSN